MFDSFGDGWDSAYYNVYTQDGKLLYGGNLPPQSQKEGVNELCLIKNQCSIIMMESLGALHSHTFISSYPFTCLTYFIYFYTSSTFFLPYLLAYLLAHLLTQLFFSPLFFSLPFSPSLLFLLYFPRFLLLLFTSLSLPSLSFIFLHSFFFSSPLSPSFLFLPSLPPFSSSLLSLPSLPPFSPYIFFRSRAR